MERASRNIKNGASMAGSFVGQRGPREQMRIGEEEDAGRKKDDEGRKREGDCSRKRNAIFASLLPPPHFFVFDAPNSARRSTRFHRGN